MLTRVHRQHTFAAAAAAPDPLQLHRALAGVGGQLLKLKTTAYRASLARVRVHIRPESAQQAGPASSQQGSWRPAEPPKKALRGFFLFFTLSTVAVPTWRGLGGCQREEGVQRERRVQEGPGLAAQRGWGGGGPAAGLHRTGSGVGGRPLMGD
jgi:hypothetical protein